ncbi:concanavalin A-like lectin/glucanase domain-containing protein [Aspergillus heterothallicus]
MYGPLPAQDSSVGGTGPWVNASDVIDFAPGSAIPSHLVYWRYPDPSSFQVSPRHDHPNSLRIRPSVYNITGNSSFTPEDSLSLIMRRQSHTLFTFNVDLAYNPKVIGEEAGLTLFLTQFQHIDLGVTRVSSRQNKKGELSLRFRVEGRGNENGTLPETKVIPVPRSWQSDSSIELQIQAVSETSYCFSAASSRNRSDRLSLGCAPATILSGGTGAMTGTLVGTYATSNGVIGNTNAYFSRWRYSGHGQGIGDGWIVTA